ncbi:septum-promoting GTP-binding protein 1 isoform X1 [Daucus carota subsp. sativus]|uniref:septum-promoting GTP-binding protein 1 isoform X1 n=1 Tax=Daucus carota subsp. sativus TaxID=79200 RepID=UPI0030830AC3
MSRSCRKIILRRINVKRIIVRRMANLRHCVHSFWSQIFGCCAGKSVRYRQLLPSSIPRSLSPPPTVYPSREPSGASCCCDHHEDSSDLVTLKISLLGDCQIGKTSFLAKYTGREKSRDLQEGLTHMDKTLCVKGARIAYTMWEVPGNILFDILFVVSFILESEIQMIYDAGNDNQKQLPIACADSVAILFMFDLTSRCTLNSVITWYQEARKWNQSAILVIVGTKFDEFVQLPMDLQWTIANQARTYAKALNATLFFSSSTYNINVNKIFKFITAKIFNLPWSVERNLTIGEPIIDF